MAWDGYWTYAGQEFINAERTQQYAAHAGAGWFKGCTNSADLPLMLGERYRTPWLDPAPWSDPDVPESYQFWGAYPLDVTGVEDSTRVGNVTESIGNGGTVGRVRHATRAVVFSVALVGANGCAVEYGLRWLRRLLLGAACDTQATESCSGADMCYLSCEPALDWSDDEPVSDLTSILDCIDPYWRSLRRVVFNTGPSVTGKQETTDGGTVWTVTMTAVAGNPFEFGAEVPIVEGFGKATEPYVCEPPGVSTMTGSVVPDAGCAPVSFVPVFDPLCPAFVEPPTYPSVPLGCYEPPHNWLRRQFTIPEEFVPLWGEVVPKIEVHAGSANVRNLRLRFYADVDRKGTLVGAVDPDTGEVLGDPCGYCGDILVSYVPANQTLVIDGSDELVYVEGAGSTGQRRADSLVFSAFRDGSGRTVTAPMMWPSLSCGFGYIVTVDTEQTADLPSVDLSLYPKAV